LSRSPEADFNYDFAILDHLVFYLKIDWRSRK